MRCEQCGKIAVCEIKTPMEYSVVLEAFDRMVKAGELEIVYQTCPMDMILLRNGKFFAEKLFHQFRCTKCGTIYGMLVNTKRGGQIKINEKAFDPADYPDKEKEDSDAADTAR
ncbi:hypothetical protein [Ruminococcus sp. Marseille-P6503]|uniref:hypothetical protein n=1 Tax=Ruminococcus sp. Marseille-P6503 TaxID=2364796 RepID=UPI000F545D5C|nr:hypothetical protein [Ruminococcus sp. Marseille-P6503]